MLQRIDFKAGAFLATPIEGDPTEPGDYLALVPRWSAHRDGVGVDAVIVRWSRDGRTGGVFPDHNHPDARWVAKVSAELAA